MFSYIKPQLSYIPIVTALSCILLFSYIKPQPMLLKLLFYSVSLRMSIHKKWQCRLAFCANVLKNL